VTVDIDAVSLVQGADREVRAEGRPQGRAERPPEAWRPAPYNGRQLSVPGHIVVFSFTDLLHGDDEAVTAEVEAYRYILRRIREGELMPGARVRTEDIASEVGMSRQPVREAIRRLEAEGYVTSRPNRGAMVSKYTPEQLLELFEIRAVLEGLSIRVAASRVTAGEIAQLEELLDRMQKVKDPTAWLVCHRDFHLYLSNLSARPRLMREIARMHAALEPYLRLWFVHTGTPADSREDHMRLVRAMRSGYPTHAEEIMRDHVLETAPQIIEYLEANGSAAPADAGAAPAPSPLNRT
jgi:DNA-binding GntR family transcriptional regulator